MMLFVIASLIILLSFMFLLWDLLYYKDQEIINIKRINDLKNDLEYEKKISKIRQNNMLDYFVEMKKLEFENEKKEKIIQALYVSLNTWIELIVDGRNDG